MLPSVAPHDRAITRLVVQFRKGQPKALTATIAYTDTEVVGLDEDSLGLWVRDGAEWSTEGIGVTARYTAANQLEATIAHLSQFAIFGDQQWRIFLPLVRRGN